MITLKHIWTRSHNVYKKRQQNIPFLIKLIKIKYMQQCPNWYFVAKTGKVKTIVNKITKQNNFVKSVTGHEKHY